VNEFLEAADGYVPLLIALIVLAAFWSPIRKRIASGSEVDVGGVFTLGAMVTDTDDAQSQARAQGETVEIFGEPDQLKLVFKAQGSMWKKSTKALEMPDGCLVQVTTERQGADGSWTTAEALEFVPGVRLVPQKEGFSFGPLNS
jgi:hypothetical protein